MGLGVLPIAHAATKTQVARLRRLLREERWPPELARVRGCRYRGPADFVLEHGRVYVPESVPLILGAPRQCFGNAIVQAIIHGYRYVEGFAVASSGGQAVIHHGWNVTPDGKLVDSTWANTGVAYLGVEFSIGRADDATWNGDASVLDDLKRGWPLLREPWSGEDWEREWEPSEALAPLLAGQQDEQVQALIALYRAAVA